VKLGQGSGDRQAEAGSGCPASILSIGAVEALEDQALIAFADAGSVVLNLQASPGFKAGVAVRITSGSGGGGGSGSAGGLLRGSGSTCIGGIDTTGMATGARVDSTSIGA